MTPEDRDAELARVRAFSRALFYNIRGDEDRCATARNCVCAPLRVCVCVCVCVQYKLLKSGLHSRAT
jgi:hypothetical protein